MNETDDERESLARIGRLAITVQKERASVWSAGRVLTAENALREAIWEHLDNFKPSKSDQ